MRHAATFLPIASLAILLASGPFLPLARADYVYYGNWLPDQQMDPGVAWTGQFAYAFGGWNGWNRNAQIVKYDPATDTVTLMGRQLPVARDGVAAAWVSPYAYVFGGHDGTSRTDTILRYNPGADTLIAMTARLPAPADHVAAVTVGSSIYLFGGYTDNGGSNQILRYTPSTDTLTTLSATLAAARSEFPAVYTGTYVYLPGGQDQFGTRRDDIQRFDPATGTLTVLSTKLPESRGMTSAVWTGTHVVIMGGWGATSDITFRFDPATNTVATMNAKAHTFRAGAFWSGTDAYLLASTFGSVIRFNPYQPAAPASLQAASGPGFGQVRLTWTPPDHDDAVTNYRIHRGTASGATSFLAEVGNVTSYTDATAAAGQTYYYRVAAKNAFGEGLRTSEVSARAATTPSAPLGFAVTGGPGRGELTLTWSAPADPGGLPITNYRVYAGDTSGSTTLLEEIGPVLTYTDGTFADGATRYYRVQAVTAAGAGPTTAVTSGTTFRLPGAPMNLDAAPGPSIGSIQLTWQPPADSGGNVPSHYRVYRGLEPGNETFVADATGGYVDEGLSPLIVYYYRVSAVNAVGEGPLAASVRESPNPWPFRPLEAKPSGWSDRELLALEQSVPIPALDVPVLVVDGRPNPANPNLYDVSLTVAGMPLPTVGVNSLGLVQTPVHLELVKTEGQTADVDVRLVARSDPREQTCLFTVGGSCGAAIPVDPANPGWFTTSATQASLTLEFLIRVDGELVAHNFVVLPALGQAVPA